MANQRTNKPGKNRSQQVETPAPQITNINDLYRFDSQRMEEIRYKDGDYRYYGTGMIVGVDVETYALSGINNHLEVRKDDAVVSGQGNFVDYASKTQLLLKASFDKEGNIRVDGWELSEPQYLKTGSINDKLVIGTTQIVGGQFTNPIIIVNPLESVQEYGVSQHYEAAKNGFYGDGLKMQEFSSELLGDISCRKYANGGFMKNITPSDVALLMQRESDFVILMRDNEMGFVHSDAGKTISNSYLQRQLDAYEQIYAKKFPLETISSVDRNIDIIQQRRANFEEVVKSPEFIAAERENRNQFYREYAEYQVSAISKALEERRFTSPEQVVRAEEQLKYYSSYAKFAELSSEWNSRIISVNNAAVEAGIITEDEKKHMLAYLSNQNGFSKDNYESLCSAFSTISSRMSQENSVTNGNGGTSLSPEKLEYYSSQLIYLEELIRTHPENPINKPNIPITSSIDANVQKVDASLEIRVRDFNNKPIVQENPNNALSLSLLANRDRCDAFIKANEKKPEMAEAVSIVRDAIHYNRYDLSQSTYDSFIERKNEALVLKLIAESKGENPVFTYEELLEVHKKNSPEALKDFLISKANIDYSYTNMDSFWSSPKLLAAINNPEGIVDSTSSSPLLKHSVDDFSDPVKCQTMKKELIIAFDKAREEGKALDALIRDIELIDNHIIENRMALTANQRNINHYDFDNVYAVRISDEIAKEIKDKFGVDNIEKFKDPLYIQELIDKETIRVRLQEELKVSENGEAPNKGDAKAEAQQKEEAIQTAINNDEKIQFLRCLLTRKEEELKLKYDISSEENPSKKDSSAIKIPESVRLENELVNWGIEHKKEIEKIGSFDDRVKYIKENFSGASDDLLQRPGVHIAIENGFDGIQSKPISINECFARLETYNSIVSEYQANSKHFDYKKFEDDAFAKELLSDKQFMKALKAGQLEEIAHPFGKEGLDKSNPLHCYIISQQLENSNNPYSQRIGRDMHAIMDSMEPELKMKTILANCETITKTRNLSIDEMSMLRDEAQRQMLSCCLQRVQVGSLSQDKLNEIIERDIQSVRTSASLGFSQKDTSQLGQIFDSENIVENRKELIKKESIAMGACAKEYEEHLKTIYELTKKTIVENESEKGKAGFCMSTSEQIAKIQTIQTFQNFDNLHRSLDELNALLLNNKFYLERASQIAKDSETISRLNLEIEATRNPVGKLSYDQLTDYVSQNDGISKYGSQESGWKHKLDRMIGKFQYQKELDILSRYQDDIRLRDDRIESLGKQIEQLQERIEINKNVNGVLASLESKQIDLDASIAAYSSNGKVLENISQGKYLDNKIDYLLSNVDIKDERFITAVIIAESRGANLHSTWDALYETYKNELENGKQPISKEEFINSKKEELKDTVESFIKESNQEYVKFTKPGELESRIRELDIVNSDLTSLREYIAITGAMEKAREYYEHGSNLSIQEFAAETAKLGTIKPSKEEMEIPRVCIGQPTVEAISFKPEDEPVKQAIRYIYDKDNIVFVERTETFLKTHSIDELNPEARAKLDEYLSNHAIVTKFINEKQEEFIKPNLHPNVPEKDKDKPVEFSAGHITAIALSEIKLPPMISSYFEENSATLTATKVLEDELNGKDIGGKDIDDEHHINNGLEAGA